MKCPRCEGFASAKNCASCGWHQGDALPTDAHELRRAEVLLYLKAYRPDLAQLFESGQTVDGAVEVGIARIANQVAEQVDKAEADRPGLDN